ncbi:MAG: hypothetical protein ABSB73_11650, partial [Solirubrobacteraceae bacterium]
MPDLIPPIVVEIISRSGGFEEGIDKAKADMAGLSAAANDAAGDADQAMQDADESIEGHAEKIGSNMEGLAGDVAMGVGAVPAAAEDTKAAVADADETIAGHAASIGSNMEGLAGDVAVGMGAVPAAAQDAEAGAERVSSATSDMRAGAASDAEATGGAFEGMGKKIGLAALGAGAVLGGAAYEGVKASADFQTAMTQLVTGAGEAQKNIGLVSQGILAMAPTVAQTPAELAKGMYLIESAGYHGAAGLSVLKAS